MVLETQMSKSGVARYLNISATRVDQLVASGALSPQYPVLGRLFDRNEVDALLERRRRQALEDYRVKLPG